jgi:hypothetical protein
MSNMRRKSATTLENQMSLFDIMVSSEQTRQEPAPGSLAIGQQIRQLLSNALKSADVKRWEVAGRMGEYIGTEISESMLNSWTAESKEGYRFPLEYLPAFCWATGNYELLEMVTKVCGCYIVKSEEVALLELARLEQAEQSIQSRKKQVREYMKKVHQPFSGECR